MQWHLQRTLRLPYSDTTSCLLGKHNSNGDSNGDGDKSVQIFELLNCILLLFYLLLLLFIIYFHCFHFSPLPFFLGPFGFTFDIFLCTPCPNPPQDRYALSALGHVRCAMCSSTDRHEIYINLLFIAFWQHVCYVFRPDCCRPLAVAVAVADSQRHAATCRDLQRLATCCHLQFCLVFKC